MKILWFIGLFGLILIDPSYCPPTPTNTLPISNFIKQIKAEKEKEVYITRLMLTFRQHESAEDYSAIGQSGEKGAYQFISPTWKRLCRLYYHCILQPTKENQDKVARLELERLVTKGYTTEQIASIWNSGLPNCTKRGINKAGVEYDVAKYVQKFMEKYNHILSGSTPIIPRFFYPTRNISNNLITYTNEKHLEKTDRLPLYRARGNYNDCSTSSYRTFTRSL
jgi:hypothetical protein